MTLKADVLSQTAINNLAVNSEAFIPVLNSKLEINSSSNNQISNQQWNHIKNSETTFLNKTTLIGMENNNLDMLAANYYYNSRNNGKDFF